MSTPRGGVLVVCGLRSEADIAKGGEAYVEVLVGGGDTRRLVAELGAAAPHVGGFLSFGVAGGLAPGLAPGDIVVARDVTGPDGRRLPADAAWTAALAERLSVPTAGIAGVDRPLADPKGKAALHAATGAVAVDMETHIVAACALDAGRPFAAVRVITDSAERALPHAATVGMRADGQVDLAAIFASLARDPRQVPALIRTGLDARRAFASLLRCRQRLGPDFAFVDLGHSLLDMP